MVESKFQDQVLHFLRTKVGGYWIKIHVSAYQSKGEPDIVGVYKGQFYAFELKTDNYQATDTQREKLRRITLAGGVAMEIRDTDGFDKLKKLFNV